MSVGLVVIICFAIVGVSAIGITIADRVGDYKKEEIESKQKVAEKAMSNEVARVKIHDISAGIPWITEKRIEDSDGKDALKWYRKGFEDGSRFVKEEAKKILSRSC